VSGNILRHQSWLYKSPSCAERTQGDSGAEFPLPRTLNRVRTCGGLVEGIHGRQ